MKAQNAFFPTPLRDESLYSLISRYRLSLPYANTYIAKKHFAYESAFNTANSVGQNASFFYDQCSEFWANEKSFIRIMTSANLLFPFIEKSVHHRLYSAFQRYTCQIVPLLRQHLYFPNHDFSSLKYCPKCITQDSKQYGVAYWHRSHCVWFVTACWQHGCVLINVHNKSRFELPPQENCHQSVQAMGTELSFAGLVHELLVGRLPWTTSLSSLHDCYQYKAISKKVELKQFAEQTQAELMDIYPSDFLKALKVRDSFNGNGNRCWVFDVMNTLRPVHIPEYLLVIGLLFGNIEGLRTGLLQLEK